MRVCLERTVELEGARLRLRDWPGIGGPVVHVPDPLSPSAVIIDALAAALAPRHRVLSLEPRAGQPYQVQTADLRATFEQFGFVEPALIGERLGCIAALGLAAWYPEPIAHLVLVDPTAAAPPGHERSIVARSLRDCPPDWQSLRNALHCPVIELRWTDVADAKDLQTFLRLP